MHRRTEWVLFPDNARAVLEPLVEKWIDLVPDWVTELFFLWDQEDPDTPAITQVQDQYRCAKVIFKPSILYCTDPFREVCVVHELIHIPTMGMKRAAHQVLEALNTETENPALYRWAFEEIDRACEAAVQDLTDSIMVIREIAND